MRWRVQVTARATRDTDHIYEWINARSADGSERWYQAFLNVLQQLTQNANTHALAPEAETLGVDLRQVLFKTRKGRTFRALFVVDGQVVHVVGVRGVSQDKITAEDIELP